MLQFGGMMIEEKDSTGRYKSIINLNKKRLKVLFDILISCCPYQ